MADPLSNVSITMLSDMQLVSLAAPRGGVASLSDAVSAVWGVALPRAPHHVQAGDLAFIWAGPERWLVTSTGEADLTAVLNTHLDGLAAMTEQGSSRITFRVSGPGARARLATLVGIDLHPRAFAPGDTALTIAAHMNVQLWQIDATPTYDISVFRSLADSFHRALIGLHHP